MSARQRIVRDLERAANHIGEVTRRKLEILVRQAVLLLRNVPDAPDEKWFPFKRTADQEDDPGMG